MAESHDLGKKGEELAIEHLKKAGFKILFQNWQWEGTKLTLLPKTTNSLFSWK